MPGGGGGVSSGWVPWDSEGVHPTAQNCNSDAHPTSQGGQEPWALVSCELQCVPAEGRLTLPGHQVLRFYRNERIFLLQCVRHTLTHALDPASQHYMHFTQFVDCHLKPALFEACWQQFETSVMTAAVQDSHGVRRGGRGRGRDGVSTDPCVCLMQTPEMMQESSLWNLQEQVSCCSCCLCCSTALVRQLPVSVRLSC